VADITKSAQHNFRRGDFDRRPFWAPVLYPEAGEAGSTTMGPRGIEPG